MRSYPRYLAVICRGKRSGAFWWKLQKRYGVQVPEILYGRTVLKKICNLPLTSSLPFSLSPLSLLSLLYILLSFPSSLLSFFIVYFVPFLCFVFSLFLSFFLTVFLYYHIYFFYGSTFISYSCSLFLVLSFCFSSFSFNSADSWWLHLLSWLCHYTKSGTKNWGLICGPLLEIPSVLWLFATYRQILLHWLLVVWYLRKNSLSVLAQFSYILIRSPPNTRASQKVKGFF